MFRDRWDGWRRQRKLDKLFRSVDHPEGENPDAKNTFDASQLRTPLDLAQTIINFGEEQQKTSFMPGSTEGDPHKKYFPVKDTPQFSYEMRTVFDPATEEYKGFSIRHNDYRGGYDQDPRTEQISFRREDDETWVVDNTRYTESGFQIPPPKQRPKRSARLLGEYWKLLQGEDEENK